MTQTIFFTMLSFSLIMAISPGPVNLMIVTSGINHGFIKTFSFISGATIGFILLLILAALGLSAIHSKYASTFLILEILGSAFICYMGYKIITSNNKLEFDEKDKKYLKFYEGFLLQWLNPKAWIASVSGVSMFSQSNSNLFIFIIIYFIVCYLSLSFWGILGQKATHFLNTNKRMKIFNILMGSILIISAISIILSKF